MPAEYISRNVAGTASRAASNHTSKGMARPAPVQQKTKSETKPDQEQAINSTVASAYQAPAAANGVAQMVFDAALKPGAFNVVGENHNKSPLTRHQETQLANKHNLFYLTEEQFGERQGEKDVMGDPTHLRILFAMAGIKEQVLQMVGNTGNNQPHIQAITYIVNVVDEDMRKYAREEHNDLLYPLFLKLQSDMLKLKTKAALADINDITQIISPGQMLGSSKGLSQARSESMHEAATKHKNSPFMWMVGQEHANDINTEHPDREYNLLSRDTLTTYASSYKE